MCFEFFSFFSLKRVSLLENSRSEIQTNRPSDRPDRQTDRQTASGFPLVDMHPCMVLKKVSPDRGVVLRKISNAVFGCGWRVYGPRSAFEFFGTLETRQ